MNRKVPVNSARSSVGPDLERLPVERVLTACPWGPPDL